MLISKVIKTEYFIDVSEMHSTLRLDSKYRNDIYQHPSNHWSTNKSTKSYVTVLRLMFVVWMTYLLINIGSDLNNVQATVLMKVCDTREIKSITNRVCMLYKRTKNSDLKLDKQGNMRITRGAKDDYSPAKLATDCCKKGCPPHLFAYNC